MLRPLVALCFLTLTSVPACSGAEQSSGGGSEPKVGALAAGLGIARVELNQGVAIALAKDGADVQPRNAPVVVGRPGIVRVYVTPDAGWQPRPIVALLKLTANGQSTTLAATLTPAAPSDDGALDSTFVFDLGADQVAAGTSWSVELHEQPGATPPTGATDGARYPSSGDVPLGEQDAHGQFQLVVVPVQYDADGSGRLPDTSEAQLQLLHDVFEVLYPVPGVDVTVHAPMPYSTTISPTGQGWSQFVQSVCTLRQHDGAPKRQYYLGVVEPGTSQEGYCGGACVAGIAPQSSSALDDFVKCGVALGFTGISAATTGAHEIGHALGRLHAPCAPPGTSLQGVDGNFPYPDASIGAWGWDIHLRQLHAPGAFRDLMGYCQPNWVSDYTYAGLFDRISAVSATARIIGAPGRWRTATVDGHGEITWGEVVTPPTPPSGEPRSIVLLDDAGRALRTAQAAYYPLDGVEGGLLLVPEADAAAPRARVAR